MSSDASGNVVVTGYSSSSPLNIYNRLGQVQDQISQSGTYGSFLVKYSPTGQLLWAARQDGITNDQCSAVAFDQFGNILLTGYYTSSSLVLYDAADVPVATFSNKGSYASFVAYYNSEGYYNQSYVSALSGQTLLQISYSSSSLSFTSSSLSSSSTTVTSTFPSTSITSLTSSLSQSFTSSTWLSSRSVSYSNTLSLTGTSQQMLSSTFTSLAVTTTSSTFILVSTTLTETSFQSWLSVASIHTTVSTSSYLISSLQSIGSTSLSISSINSTMSGISVSVTSAKSSSTFSGLSGGSPSAQVSVTTGSVIDQAAYIPVSNQSLINSTVELLSQAIGNLVLTYEFGNQVESSASQLTQTVIYQPTQIVAFNLVYLYLAALAFGFMIVCAGCMIFCRKKKNTRRLLEADNTSLTQTTTSTQETASLTTAIVTTHLLVVPQFLMLDFGIDFRQGDLIARGGGGSIHFCQVLRQKISGFDGSPLVVKNLGQSIVRLSETLRTSFYQEVAMLYLFRDQPQFAKFYGFTEEPATILLKFYDLGSLKQFILAQNSKLGVFSYSKRQITYLLLQLSYGLAFMHSRQFVHNDIKPDNVLVEAKDKFLEPRITDFGISRLLDASTSQIRAFKLSAINGVSLAFAAPEVVLRFRQGFIESNVDVWKSGDVYAYSIVLQEIMNRKQVWS